jgi:hypothetical protein
MSNCSLLLAGAIACSAMAATAADALVDLELELPQPRFKGTPVPVKLPNLEKPRNAARPVFKLPAGCENLAVDMLVTSSDENPVIGELELITDDDADAREYVELKPGAQWVQIDLEESAAMYAVLIWHYHLEPRAYHDVIVQVSDDEDFIKGVKTVFNSDHDNTSGLGKGKDPAYVETNEGRLIDAKGIKGRYIRIFSRGSTGSDANHYTEIAVYGKR